ncbi:MAG: response regulator transcription factor [Dehalococcoidia bacterium]|nr:response regulator transcription factor [Dehalococcoidia bacterium]
MKVLVVDDHVLFRKGLVNLLSSQEDIEVIGEADDGFEALEKTRDLMPDIILMDITMPRCDGLEATRLIKAEMPYARIVILTVSEEESDLYQAVKHGAQGYLLKSVDPDDLFRLIRAVNHGEAQISPPVASNILAEFSSAVSPPPAPEDALTSREREVLDLVARGATNKGIAASLSITENTVKNHLKNILEKLHFQNRVQAAAYAVRHELARRSPPPRSKPEGRT